MDKILTNINPATQEVIAEYNIASDKEIKDKMSLAKKCFNENKDKKITSRLDYLQKIRAVITSDFSNIVKDIVADTAKVDVEALMTDILPTLDLIKYYEKNAASILKRDKRKTPLFLFNNKSYLEYMPLGVVLIIAPWNFPLQLALVPAITALAAGNTVVIKPSEVTPLVGEIIKEIVKKAQLPEGMLQIVQGGGEVGQKLIAQQPDKIFFTGSVATGKKIMGQAAKNLIPVELELGGKDAMIVCEDCNFERAVEAAVYGAFANTGQLCVSVERLYVAEEIYQKFVEAVVERTKELRVGSGKDSDLGAMTYSGQIDIIKKQLVDAQDKGAKVLTEIKEEGQFFHPVVLTDVSHKMKVMTEESFGPLLPIMPVKDISQAIEYANDSPYGLNASVWSGNQAQAEDIAQQLETGNVYINDVVKNIGNPHLPFGGVKDSGIGRYHGPEGLYSFSNLKSVMINKNKAKELNWFPYSEKLYDLLAEIIKINYGTESIFKKIKRLVKILKPIKDMLFRK